MYIVYGCEYDFFLVFLKIKPPLKIGILRFFKIKTPLNTWFVNLPRPFFFIFFFLKLTLSEKKKRVRELICMDIKKSRALFQFFPWHVVMFFFMVIFYKTDSGWEVFYFLFISNFFLNNFLFVRRKSYKNDTYFLWLNINKKYGQWRTWYKTHDFFANNNEKMDYGQ